MRIADGTQDAATTYEPTDDLLDDLQAGDEEMDFPIGIHRDPIAPGDVYDIDNVDSSDASEPVSTPDIPVIPANDTRPAGTTDPAEGAEIAYNIDADLAALAASTQDTGINLDDPALVAAIAVAEASAALAPGRGLIAAY